MKYHYYEKTIYETISECFKTVIFNIKKEEGLGGHLVYANIKNGNKNPKINILISK